MPIYKYIKKLGDTPLECLKRMAKENKIPDDVKITFAGRLDPAATGEMIFLSGDDVYKKDDYTHADKIYEVQYLLGISTDTGDLLGLIKDVNLKTNDFHTNSIKESFNKLVGKREQDFHNFSSKIVDGVPMWQHTKNGNIVNVKHEIEIYSIELEDINQISLDKVYERVLEITNLVNGNFRQDDIIKSWSLYKNNDYIIPIIKVMIKCSSGTYVRVLGEELGELLNIPICAYSINRTKILV